MGLWRRFWLLDLEILKRVKLQYLVTGGQLLAIGSEGDETRGQVYKAADLQVNIGAGGGQATYNVPATHHVAVTPPHTDE